MKKGDVIGVAAPSARFDAAKLQQGVLCLERLGFRVRIPEGIYKKKRYLAGSDQARAAVVNALFSDDEIKGIISVRGGFGALRILPFLDWDLFRLHPTLFMGFSDSTAFIHALGLVSGLGAVHAPSLVSLAEAQPETLASFVRVVTGSFKPMTLPPGGCLIPGRARARMTGGNLATLVHMIGTPFQPDFSDAVLFIEDIGEPAYKIDRMLTQMRMAGLFDRVKGVVCGSFEKCANAEYLPEILEEIFGPFKIPVLMGVEAGHGQTNFSLPMGELVELDAGQATLRWGST